MPIIPCTGQSQAHGRNRWFRLAEAELTTHNHGPAAEARLCLDLYSRRRGQHAPSLPVALEDPMSRYVIAPHAAHHQVIVGWDPPMQTLFGQVFDTTVEEDDAACVLWVGLEVQALTTVAALQDALQAYATLPTAVVAQLQHDQATTPPRSALQERLLQWLHTARSQPG